MSSTAGDLNTKHPNKTSEFIFKMNRLFYFFGFADLSLEGVKLSKWVVKIYNFNFKFINILNVFFVLSELGAFYTQKSLSQKKRADLLVFCIGHPVLFMFSVNMTYHKSSIRILLYNLSTVLKQVHNNLQVERDMIKKCKLYSTVILVNAFLVMALYGVQGILAVLTSSGKFSPIITAWPDINEDGGLANTARVVYYFMWWLVMMRVYAIYLLVSLITICLSYQYKNLCSYFTSLSQIFEDGNLNQNDKELKYTKAFGLGIEMHSVTLWCVNLTQKTCYYVFSSQIFLCISLLIITVNQMVNQDRTLVNVLTLLATSLYVLISTGVFMWNAGDITVEASQLSTAMFSSGWLNMQRQSARRIRPLLVVAMNQSQKPITLEALGLIKLSYESYVTVSNMSTNSDNVKRLVKTCYSVFTVLY